MGGLGRGLSSLIPTSEKSELDELTETQRLLRSMVDAGFELLDERNKVGLTAYLHVSETNAPVFFLHRPAFASLTPTSAFRLFHQVAMLSNESDRSGRFSYDNWNGIFLRSAGQRSDGIHLVATTDDSFDAGEADSMLATLNAIGSIAHQAEVAADVDDLANVRLLTEVDSGQTLVEATVTEPMRSPAVGRATSTNGDEAVVEAVLDAVGKDFVFVETREVDIDDGRAVLTTLAKADGTPSFGLAVGASDSLATAAYSALRALADQTP